MSCTPHTSTAELIAGLYCPTSFWENPLHKYQTKSCWEFTFLVKTAFLLCLCYHISLFILFSILVKWTILTFIALSWRGNRWSSFRVSHSRWFSHTPHSTIHSICCITLGPYQLPCGLGFFIPSPRQIQFLCFACKAPVDAFCIVTIIYSQKNHC